jgi:general transcription factor IIIA
MKQQLKAHEKTHEGELLPTQPGAELPENRYTCSHPSHDTQPSFSKWSLLQSHIKTAHPPICPHEECAGRVFKNAQRLKDHLKVHDQRAEDLVALTEKGQVSENEDDDEEEDQMRKKRKRSRSQAGLDDGGKSPKLRPIRSGEAGKDFACPEEGCGKRFKAVRPSSLSCFQ